MMWIRFSRTIPLVLILISFLYTTDCNENNSTHLWQNLTVFMRIWAKELSLKNREFISELLNNTGDVSDHCSKSIYSTVDAIEKLEDWSIKMVNSWGDLPPKGSFIGSLTDFGSYDQCLSIDDNDLIGSAQYCSVEFRPPVPKPMPKQQNLYHIIPNLLSNDLYANKTNALNIIANEASIFYWVSVRTAVCTPNKCTLNDIMSLSKKVSAKIGLELNSVKCETKSKFTLNTIQLFAISFITISLIAVITASICDSTCTFDTKSFGFLFVNLFSVQNSISRLVANTTSKDLSCIHGLRVLTFMWIIFGHSIQWMNVQINARSFAGKHYLTDLIAQPFFNGEYALINFLLISAVLTSYLTLSLTEGKLKNFRLKPFLILRATRLVPQLYIFLLLTFLMPSIGSGPLWDEEVGAQVRKCEKNWWLNVLLMQNLFNLDQICAIHTWFIALDYQYHLMATLLILIFLHNTTLGIYFNILIIAIFLALSSTMLYVYELAPAVIHTAKNEHFEKYYAQLYHKMPVCYGAVYFIGFLFGYGMYRKTVLNMSETSLVIIWTIINIFMTISLNDKVYWNNGQEYTPAVSAFFYPFCQVLWSVSVSMIIWLCISGQGGFVNRVLSFKLFVPLARLTYSVYLTHIWVIWYFVGSLRYLFDNNYYNVWMRFIHMTVTAYLVGFIFYLVFESPLNMIHYHATLAARKEYLDEKVTDTQLEKLGQQE